MKVPYKLLGAFSPAFGPSKAGTTPTEKTKELYYGNHFTKLVSKAV